MRTAKFNRRFIPALLTLALLLAAPTAQAKIGEFHFEEGAFAKAHPPLHQDPILPMACSLFHCFDLEGFTGFQESDWVEPFEEAPEPTQAGGHPDFTTHFRFGRTTDGPSGPYLEGDQARTIVTDAPAGAIGNPLAVPRCTSAEFYLTPPGACPPASQIGAAISKTTNFGTFNFYTPVSSIVPAEGEPALIGFHPGGFAALLKPEVRSDGDYGLRITVDDIAIPALVQYIGSTVTLWGVPHDPIHNAHRFNASGGLGTLPGEFDGDVPKPFLSAPTNCSSGPITLTQKARSWQSPDLWTETQSTAEEPTGCDQVPFEPSIAAHPSTNVADSPSGLEVDVHTPQSEGCELAPGREGELEEFEEIVEKVPAKRQEIFILKLFGAPPAMVQQAEEELEEAREEMEELGGEGFYDCGLAGSHLKDTTVTLPEGLSINPSSANGLEGCSTEEIGLTTPLGVTPQQFTKAVPSCPEASRIGSVEVDTPLLEAPAPGSVYIAEPYGNPFNSLLAIYIAVNDKERGFVAKLAGEVKADPVTGQLTTTVQNAPQLPFEHFLLHFKQGPHAPLRTPSECGTYTSTAALTPYSQPDTAFNRQEEWQVAQGPSGAGCEVPVAPDLDAGSVSPLAGIATPTVVNLRRADGSQEFSKVELTLPPGLTGKLAGVGQCADSALAAAEGKSGQEERSSPSCPDNSRIGTVHVQAGAGPDPYNTTAEAYLTGPYKGAPLSMAIVAPATAGPFDLGTVVVRVALHVDSRTGQITAVSDEFPRILEGIPLDIRSAKVVLDRPDFSRNGTSCDPEAFSGELTSTLGQSASLSERFQLAECTGLSFKPKLAIRLFGSTKRGGHPALRGVVQMPEGGANVAKASVALPRSEFLDQAHIGTVCTRVQFAEGDGNGSACPRASIYGKALATSPLVDYPLEGPVVLRSSDNELPDLVAALHGPPSQPVAVQVVGRVDSFKRGIRTTFEGVPDLPVSKFVLSMKGGKKGLLQNSTDICAETNRATAVFEGQNGKVARLAPALKNGKCGKAKRNGRGASRPAAMRGAAR